MTLSEFKSAYLGKTVGYPEGSYVGECLSLVKWYIKDCFSMDPPASGCNGARCYWSKFPNPLDTVFKKVPYIQGLIPQPGWIAVWDESVGAGAGHIDVVLQGEKDYFDGLDQNWGGRHTHVVRHNYANVYGFLVPKGESMPTELEVCLADRKKFWEERDALQKKYDDEVIAHKKTKDKLTECLNRPQNGSTEQFEINGKTETYVENGRTVTINYAVKR